MSRSSEKALQISQEQYEQEEQARDMQEMLDQQAHQQQLELNKAYQKGYVNALKNPPARSKFDIDILNAAIRRLNQLNKGIL
jgi:flagellar biosynthesis/type III secretory pathway protein FliH